MKARRAILGAIAAIGLVILVLAFFDVFTSDSGGAAKPDVGAGIKDKTIVARNFESSGKNWTLNAPEAIIGEEGTVRLEAPTLSLARMVDEKEQQVRIRADQGEYIGKPQSKVLMKGHVRVEFSGPHTGTLTTDSLEIAPDSRAGHTRDKVELTLVTQDGHHKLTGKGAEFDSKKRLVRVLESVRMDIGGEMDILPTTASVKDASKEGKPKAKGETPPRVITCQGPATVDGFKSMVVLNGDVAIKQGDDELRADRVETTFAETKKVDGEMKEPGPKRNATERRTVDRLVAEGNVRFKSSTAEGNGDRMTRNRDDNQVLLEGKPASVRYGANRIEASHLELDTTRHSVYVPAKGRLEVIPEDKQAEAMDVRWSRRLQFDPETHEAVFRGDVVFTRGEQTIECQLLRVTLDEQNRQLLACQAEGDVRVRATTAPTKENGKPSLVSTESRELAYDARKDAVKLTGNASIKQDGQTVKANDIFLDRTQSSIKVDGAGSMKAAAPARDKEPEKPIDVSWGGEMQFSRSTDKAVFRKDVKLSYGVQTLRADKLDIKLTKENKVDSFDAMGNVVVVEEGRELRADKATAKLDPNGDLKSMEATGHVSLDEGGGPKAGGRRLRAERVVARMGANKLIEGFDASGGVVVEEGSVKDKPGRILRAERMSAKTGAGNKIEEFSAAGRVVIEEGGPVEKGGRLIKADTLTAKAGADNKLETFEAKGRRVVLEEQGTIAVGETLVWNAAADLGRMSGSPVEVRQGGNAVYGGLVEFSQKRGSIRITDGHRVEATVVEGKGMNETRAR